MIAESRHVCCIVAVVVGCSSLVFCLVSFGVCLLSFVCCLVFGVFALLCCVCCRCLVVCVFLIFLLLSGDLAFLGLMRVVFCGGLARQRPAGFAVGLPRVRSTRSNLFRSAAGACHKALGSEGGGT